MASILDVETQIVLASKLDSGLNVFRTGHVDGVCRITAHGTTPRPCQRVTRGAGAVLVDWVAAVVRIPRRVDADWVC